jgi:hypothetical protein
MGYLDGVSQNGIVRQYRVAKSLIRNVDLGLAFKFPVRSISQL